MPTRSSRPPRSRPAAGSSSRSSSGSVIRARAIWTRLRSPSRQRAERPVAEGADSELGRGARRPGHRPARRTLAPPAEHAVSGGDHHVASRARRAGSGLQGRAGQPDPRAQFEDVDRAEHLAEEHGDTRGRVQLGGERAAAGWSCRRRWARESPSVRRRRPSRGCRSRSCRPRTRDTPASSTAAVTRRLLVDGRIHNGVRPIDGPEARPSGASDHVRRFRPCSARSARIAILDRCAGYPDVGLPADVAIAGRRRAADVRGPPLRTSGDGGALTPALQQGEHVARCHRASLALPVPGHPSGFGGPSGFNGRPEPRRGRHLHGAALGLRPGVRRTPVAGARLDLRRTRLPGRHQRAPTKTWPTDCSTPTSTWPNWTSTPGTRNRRRPARHPRAPPAVEHRTRFCSPSRPRQTAAARRAASSTSPSSTTAPPSPAAEWIARRRSPLERAAREPSRRAWRRSFAGSRRHPRGRR